MPTKRMRGDDGQATSLVSTSADAMAVAIEVLATRGYELTTVSDLADAVGMSRSTFFRRFGSKEDIVFADHDVLVDRMDDDLRRFRGEPLDAAIDGARSVLDHHLVRPEVSRWRHRLLHDNPALRDRELVASSRYERAFTGFLRETLPSAAQRDWAIVAYAAAIVAVHNLALRRWLRGELDDPATAVSGELRSLTEVFRPLLTDAAPATDARRVVVAVIEPGQTPAHTLAAIADAIADSA